MSNKLFCVTSQEKQETQLTPKAAVLVDDIHEQRKKAPVTGIKIGAKEVIQIFFIFLNIFFFGTNSCYALSENDLRNPKILAIEGWKYIGYGREYFDKAEQFFRKAISIDEENTNAYVGLGFITMEVGHVEFIKPYDKDQCRKALKLFDKAIALAPNDYLSHYYKGWAYICLEDYDGALKEAEIIEGDRYDACSAHFIKSKAYNAKFMIKKDASDKRMAFVEATDYLECSQSDPPQPSLRRAHELIKEVLRTTKAYDSAEKHFKRNIERKPYSIWSYFNYARLMFLRTEEGYIKDNDLTEFQRIIKEGEAKTNSKIAAMWELHVRRGQIFSNRKEYDKALDEYVECFTGNPNMTYLKKNISDLCSHFADDRCIKSWKRIIQAYLDGGDCTNAAKEFEIQYSGHPDSFVQLKDAIARCKEKKQ